ncbi:MAG: hypothetical protein ACOY93_13580 [Bacillota bacterium]
MEPVTQAFNEAMRAPERHVVARVVIDYTDPTIDQSVAVVATEEARIAYPAQTADSVEAAPSRWASLDGSWVLDGSYRLAPDTPEDADRYQMGWWGASLAGLGGAFASLFPTLTVTFLPRPIHSLRVVGDSARAEYPVDFAIRLYDETDTLLHEELVTGNAGVTWSKPLAQSVNSVTRMVLEVTRWSHEGRQVKITEFFTSVQQTYEASDLLEISLLEEREVSQGSLPVGTISANEITIRLSNEDRRFDADNEQSPLYQLLKPNRRIRAWLGVVLPDDSTEFVQLGTFWSTEWKAREDTVEATVRALDRLELLRKSTYQSATVSSNTNIYDLAVAVLTDAGLEPEEYYVDPALQEYAIPYAWFDPMSHREALRLIAEAALAQVYCDRDGVLRVEGPGGGFGSVTALEITADDYYTCDNPMRPGHVANEVIVDTQPLRPAATPEEVYRSNDPVTVPAGQSVTVAVHYSKTPVIEAAASLEGAGATITGAVYYGWGAEVTLTNSGGTDAQVTIVVTGRPLTVLSRERAIARDSASITENGVLRYQFTSNPLVQTLAVAQRIADTILASAKDPRRDLEVNWRGNPALELGDRITVKGRDYHVIRQQIDWAGALSATTTGRRAT